MVIKIVDSIVTIADVVADAEMIVTIVDVVADDEMIVTIEEVAVDTKTIEAIVAVTEIMVVAVEITLVEVEIVADHQDEINVGTTVMMTAAVKVQAKVVTVTKIARVDAGMTGYEGTTAVEGTMADAEMTSVITMIDVTLTRRK